MLKVNVISLPYIFQVLYVLCFTRSRYQVSVYRTIGPLVTLYGPGCHLGHVTWTIPPPSSGGFICNSEAVLIIFENGEDEAHLIRGLSSSAYSE